MINTNRKEIITDVIFAIIMSVIIFVAKQLIGNYEMIVYLINVVGGVILYMVIIQSLSYNYKRKYSQINLINPFKYRQNNIVFNHYFLPILLLIILPWYLYFSNHYRSLLIAGVLSFIIYFLYLTNLRAFFKYNLKLEHKTHFIYDLLNVLNYFFFLFVLLSFVDYFGVNKYLSLFFLIISEIFFYFICFTRYYEKIIKKLFVIGIILISFNFLAILILNFLFLKILVLTVGSYVNFIIFNRKYLQQDYKLDKNDYIESFFIQLISLGFALII